ncbi:MAG: hypothetical protein RQ826_06370 [Xanthomonadales bacterium]|nr:hypothetical protein [Xanthomonadales bacterium]
MSVPKHLLLQHSIPQSRRFALNRVLASPRRFRRFVALLFAIGLAQVPAFAPAAEWALEAERIEWNKVSVSGLDLRLAADGALELKAQGLSLAGVARQARDLSLVCPRLLSEVGDFCSDGAWHVELQGVFSQQPFSAFEGKIAELTAGGDSPRLVSSVRAAALEARLQLVAEGAAWGAKVEWADQPLSALQGLEVMPAQLDWVSAGSFSGSLESAALTASPLAAEFRLTIAGLSFDSPGGRFAGGDLDLSAEGSVALDKAAKGRLSGALNAGELLIDNFYRDFSTAPLRVELQPSLQGSQLRIDNLLLADDGALSLAANASMAMTDPAGTFEMEIQALELKFPRAYERYMESMASVWMLDGLGITGSVAWHGSWQPGELRSGDLEVDDLSIVDVQRERFAVSGLTARINPQPGDEKSQLAWDGLLFGRINLGSGAAVIDAEPGRFALARPLELGVMGGRLALEQLAVALPGYSGAGRQEPSMRLEARLDGLQMDQLTEALGWPKFSGEVSGVIPGVRFEDGVLALEGEVEMRVFDGRVLLRDFAIERPFGVLPSLAAEIELDDLALEPLTGAFSFGQISGRLDGYVRDLRLLGWKPVAFDAWVGTPERQQGASSISRKAVNRLTTIGGGGVSTALSNPLLRLFGSFSYRRLGLGCRLADYVCSLYGLGEQEDGVLILEGAGIPKIMIRAYNRRIDWPQLVANLMAVSPEQGVRIGD